VYWLTKMRDLQHGDSGSLPCSYCRVPLPHVLRFYGLYFFYYTCINIFINANIAQAGISRKGGDKGNLLSYSHTPLLCVLAGLL